jgi:hypothetical protein
MPSISTLFTQFKKRPLAPAARTSNFDELRADLERSIQEASDPANPRKAEVKKLTRDLCAALPNTKIRVHRDIHFSCTGPEVVRLANGSSYPAQQIRELSLLVELFTTFHKEAFKAICVLATHNTQPLRTAHQLLIQLHDLGLNAVVEKRIPALTSGGRPIIVPTLETKLHQSVIDYIQSSTHLELDGTKLAISWRHPELGCR